LQQKTAQVGQGPTLPYEIIYQKIVLAGLHGTFKSGGSAHSFPATGPRVADYVALNYARVNIEPQPFTEKLCQCCGYAVYPLVFDGMHRRQNRVPALQQTAQCVKGTLIHERSRQKLGGRYIAGLGGRIGSVRSHRFFIGQDYRIWEFTPWGARDLRKIHACIIARSETLVLHVEKGAGRN